MMLNRLTHGQFAPLNIDGIVLIAVALVANALHATPIVILLIVLATGSYAMHWIAPYRTPIANIPVTPGVITPFVPPRSAMRSQAAAVSQTPVVYAVEES